MEIKTTDLDDLHLKLDIICSMLRKAEKRELRKKCTFDRQNDTFYTLITLLENQLKLNPKSDEKTLIRDFISANFKESLLKKNRVQRKLAWEAYKLHANSYGFHRPNQRLFYIEMATRFGKATRLQFGAGLVSLGYSYTVLKNPTL